MNAMNDNDLAWVAAMAAKGERDTPHPSYTPELRDRFVTVKGESEKFNHMAFAKWLVDESGYYFLTLRDDSMYVYDEGIYKPNGHTYIKTIIDEVMGGELLTPFMETAVIAKVRARTYVEREVFDEGEDIINMANGLYNIKTDDFRPHTHAYKSLSKSPVRYDPIATCPNFDTFIKEVVEPHRVDTIYEMGGYALMKRKRVKRGFILLGKSDTGKTQLMNFFTEFIGETAAVNPAALVRDPHAGSELYGKHLNIVDDLGDAPLGETGVLKSMIGDGLLSCNMKYQQAFTFRPYVMNIWGCNVLPKVEDKYFGDKFDILKFLNIYGGHTKPDRYLGDRITTPEELSGFFNKAVAAFRGVIKTGEFTGSSGQGDRQREWLEESTPCAKFINARCDTGDDTILTPKNAFHKQYDLFVKNGGLKREKRKDVKAHLESIGVYSTKVTERANDHFGLWCYLGIKLVPKTSETPNIFVSPPDDAKRRTDPDIYPIVPTRKEDSSIVEGTMETKLGSLPQKEGVDSDTVLDTKTDHTPHQSKPLDYTGDTKDISLPDNFGRKMQTTFKKLHDINPRDDGWSVGEILGEFPEVTQESIIHRGLTMYGTGLGFKRTDRGWKL